MPTKERRYMKRIDSLTPEQQARMPSFADEFIARELSTEPADHEKVERAIRACYAHARIAPVPIIWVKSPLVATLAAPIAALIIEKHRRGDVALTRDDIRSAVGSAVGAAVGAAVAAAVDSAVRSAVDSAVGSAVGSAVRSAVGSAVDSAV